MPYLMKQCCVQHPAGQKHLNGSCEGDDDFDKDEDHIEDKIDTIACW